MEKECLICHVTKPNTDFYASKQHKGGLYPYCKPCQIAKVAQMAKERPRRHQAPEGMKRCERCKETKPVSEFYKYTSQFDGLSRKCAACSRETHKAYVDAHPEDIARRAKAWRAKNPKKARDYEIKKNYGLPFGSYETMLAAQDGKCGICGTSDPAPQPRFSVDHDHDTKIVRGLLCAHCNLGIGHLRHDLDILRKAAEYLLRYS